MTPWVRSGRLKHALVPAVALALVAISTRAAPAQTPAPVITTPAVVAEVGGQAITLSDLRVLIARAQAGADSKALLATMTPDGQAALLQRVVDDRMLALAAKAEKLDTRPDVRFLVEQATARALAMAYADAKLSELAPTREAARAYVESHPDEFRVGSRVRAHHLVVGTLEKAEAARAAIVAGQPFEQIAAASSEDLSTKSKGGDLGWVPRGVMVKPFEVALFQLKAGELSAPVRTSFGFHVIRVDEIDTGTVPAFEVIESAVTQAMVTQAFDRLKTDLARRYGVTIHQNVLEQFGR